MRIQETVRRWKGAGAVVGAVLATNAAACGGSDNSPTISSEDGGIDGRSSSPDSASSGSASSGSTSGGGSGTSGSGSGGTGDGGADATVGADSGLAADATIADSAASGDSSTVDGANPVDAGGSDSANASDGPDANTGCVGENTACDANGSAGLCKSGTCATCATTTDDSNCTTAYGSASKAYLCLGGVCTAGDCRTDGDCATNPNGGLCGVSTPNLCGKCTTDPNCAGHAGGAVCNTGTGQCVVGTCSLDAGVSLGGQPATCSVNASDICCTAMCQPGSGVNSCCPGPNAATYCAAKLGNAQAACLNNVCTACPQVPGSNPSYLVDPNGGSDVAGTGDATTSGCAFKTITRALQVIGTTPVVATTIRVLGPATVAAGETFPIALPTNVTVTSSGGAVRIDVPAGTSGFTLSSLGSGIAGGIATLGDGGTGPGLTINGQHGGTNDATFGVVVDTGTGVSVANSPRISNVVVTSFLDDGVLVENSGIVRIGSGVTSTLNGTTAARKDGLHVTGSGRAIIDVPSGEAPAHFDANTNHGILVDTVGSIAVTATVNDVATGLGTVTASRNYAAGVWIEQTPGTPPANTMTGLVAFGNTNGHGLRFVSGSKVWVRNSVSLGNQGDGVLVSAGANGASSNDISKIDLGAAADAGGIPGGNTFQEPLGSGNNGGAGICLQVRPNTGTLHATGNVFGAINCGTSAGTLTLNSGACANGACAGGVCDLGITNTVGNTIDVSMCGP